MAVTVDEIQLMVNIALGGAGAAPCNGIEGPVTVAEILTAVNNALNGCPS